MGALIGASRDGSQVGVGEYAKGLEQLEAGRDIDYDGASGRLELDAAGDITSGSFAVSQVRAGKLERVKIVEFSADE